jgi:hypothetical protein
MKANIEGEPAAIQFDQDYLQIDPRQADQIVTTCYLRPLEGPKRLFVGAAVFNPNDHYELPFYGRKLALARALQSFLGYATQQDCWSMARHLIWQYLQLEEMQTKQAAAAQEVERLEELRERSAVAVEGQE